MSVMGMSILLAAIFSDTPLLAAYFIGLAAGTGIEMLRSKR